MLRYDEDADELGAAVEQMPLPNAMSAANELSLNAQQSESLPNSAVHIYEIGFYGWRKKCLYFVLILATVAIAINAVLTLWIIAVLSFSFV